MDERYTLTVEREIPGPIAAVFDAWLDAATMALWMTPAPGISVDAASDPVVGGRFRVVMKGRGEEIVHAGEYLVDRTAHAPGIHVAERAGRRHPRHRGIRARHRPAHARDAHPRAIRHW